MTQRTEELRTLIAGDSDVVPYLLRRSSRRRSLALRVSESGEVVVNAPMRLAQRDIDAFVGRHRDWVAARLASARAHAFAWRDGAELPWLGGRLLLRVRPGTGRPSIRREDAQLVCAAPVPVLPVLVTRWYQREARVLLGERLAHHARRAGLALPPLRLSGARGRWGSLSASGVVSLNWRLLKATPEQIDYVICHELAHFRQRNHAPAFWREVEILYPNWKNVRSELRQNGRLYFQF